MRLCVFSRARYNALLIFLNVKCDAKPVEIVVWNHRVHSAAAVPGPIARLARRHLRQPACRSRIQ